MVNADLNLDDLAATFAIEAADDLAALEAGLLALEDAPRTWRRGARSSAACIR